MRGNQDQMALAFQHHLGFEYLKQSIIDFAILSNTLQRLINDIWPDRASLGKLNRHLSFRRATDNVDLVGAILPDRQTNLAQAVVHLSLDLVSHTLVIKSLSAEKTILL